MFFQNKQKGFTLIELLVVIAILGILSSVAISATSGFRQRARDTAAFSNARSISPEFLLCDNNNQTLTNPSLTGTAICSNSNVIWPDFSQHGYTTSLAVTDTTAGDGIWLFTVSNGTLDIDCDQNGCVRSDS